MSAHRERLRRTIVQTTDMTCETLAFMFPMLPPEDGREPGEQEHDDVLRVRVYFEGPVDGSLVLSMPREMLPELAANMLGLDPDATTREQRADAARELCNVVCGNVLPAVAGPEPVFSVSPPELCSDAPAPDSAACVSARTWLDEGWVEVEFSVTGGIDRLPCPGEDPDGLRLVV
ncbi:MAG: hypothetical protein GF393_11245 [Armatimonadia bacterium]|nr:hypothetical protein [Armatimonadia bacterium]